MTYEASWCCLHPRETTYERGEIFQPRRTLRIRRVVEKTELAASSIWRLAQRGLSQRLLNFSPGCTAWFEHEIDEWLSAKAKDRGTASRAW